MSNTPDPCVVCMDEINQPYTIQCGSTTPHIICSPCELAWRLKSSPTPEGRKITCPMCRTLEHDTSKRSTESLQAELSHVYFELATKKGKPSTMVNDSLRDYIRILETVASVPHIQLDGLFGVAPSGDVPTVYVSRRDRTRIEMESRVVRAVVSRQAQQQERAARQEAQELQRQAGIRERAEREEVARLARNGPNAAVWCESGNVRLGICPTQRRTNRACSYAGCTKRVCSRCDKCTSH
jgi:hypothetical protein